MAQVLAAADIGSNTAHLLVASVDRGQLRRLANESEWLSLGEVVARDGCIPDHLADRLVATLQSFLRLAGSYKATETYVFATEAMRRAANCQELLSRIRLQTGIQVDLVSPAREAELGLRGALQDTRPANPHLMIETGGGSVQVAWCEAARIVHDESLPIGTGALLAASGLQQPATTSQVDRLQRILDDAVESLAKFGIPRSAIACGGVARGVWRALHPDGDRTIHREELRFLIWDARRLSHDQIIARYGVKPKRAATLLPGALVYLTLLTRFGLEEMEVSQFGVREGAILEMAHRAS